MKGVNFVGLRDAGDPVELASRYSEAGADEICFLDISASHLGRETTRAMVTKVALETSVPLTVGGGVRELSDVQKLLDAGADKVAINSGAVRRPEVISEVSARYGCQVLVVAIDARSEPEGGFAVFTHGGRKKALPDAIEWAKTVAERGAGEILLTSMDRDGTGIGYDISLTRAVVDAVSIPVIASGGVGTLEHLEEAFDQGGAEAALAASIFHDGHFTIEEAKAHLISRGVRVRPVAPRGTL